MKIYIRKSNFNPLVFSLFITYLLLYPPTSMGQDYSRGEELFQPCKACHMISDQKLIGPGLKGITERQTREWLIPYIRNSQAVIQSGDEYAVQLWEEFKIPMPPYENYTEEDVNALLDYIENFDKPGEETAKVEEAAHPEGEDTHVVQGLKEKEFMGDTEHPWANFRISIIISIILIVISIIDLTITKVIKAKFIHLIIILISLAVITEITIHEAQALGRQQYYEPDQPVAFSHEIHAGQNQIDCKYCHTTVEVSKQAGIPHVQMCMNCHNVIRKGTNTGTEEISKIYDALKTGKPIEWIRIHNLPDHVYFSHAQHVGVGKLDCTECHGKVETMDRIMQVNSLGMGWCIECHRLKEVQYLDNDFYSKYTSLHEQLKAGEINKITVDMVGGSECSKCHY